MIWSKLNASLGCASPVAQNELPLTLFGTRAVSYDSLSTGSKRCDRKGFKWQNRGKEWGKRPVRSEEPRFPEPAEGILQLLYSYSSLSMEPVRQGGWRASNALCPCTGPS